MRKGVSRIVFLLLSLAVSYSALSQAPLRTIITPNKVNNVSIDRYSFIYYSDENGNVYKLDSLGNLLFTFSPRKRADVTLLEAWRNVNILVFYRNYQEFIFLNRFLTEAPRYELNQQTDDDQERSVGFARLATLSGDNNLWVIDDDDFSLKKLDLQYGKVQIHTPLELVLEKRQYDFSFMREYQNLLFINDRNAGVLIFDNLGNYKNRLEVATDFFSFAGDYLYYLQSGKLHLVNIYKGEQKSISLPGSRTYTYGLIGNKKLYLFTGQSIEIYYCEECVL